MSRTTWDDLPAVGARGQLIVAQHHSADVRIDHLDSGDLVVVAPRYGGDIEPPQTGTAMTMTWCTMRGRFTARVRLAERTPGRVTLWRLCVDGPPQREQRRAYVRAAATIPVRLSVPFADEPAPAQITARTLDLSEAAAMVDLSNSLLRPSLRSLPSGTDVTAILTLPEREVSVPARLHWRDTDDRSQVLVRFTAPEGPVATLLRRSVLEWQRRDRALHSSAAVSSRS